MPLGDHHAEAWSIGEDRQECHVVIVFQQDVGWGGFADNAAENTIHLNYRQFRLGFGRGNHLKLGWNERQTLRAFWEMS